MHTSVFYLNSQHECILTVILPKNQWPNIHLAKNQKHGFGCDLFIKGTKETHLASALLFSLNSTEIEFIDISDLFVQSI